MTMNKQLYDEIVRLAYDFYEKRGKAHGFDLEDWLKAERIVMERHAAEIVREASLASTGEGKSKGVVRRVAPKTPKRPRQSSRKSPKK